MKHNCPTIIAPSLLSCDLARIADDAKQMMDMGADWLVSLTSIHGHNVDTTITTKSKRKIK